MSKESGDHHRGAALAENICNLLLSLSPSTYDEISPKIEYWIEFALTERLTTICDLVEGVSSMAWESLGSKPETFRFLEEYRDAPHRSEQTRSFVDELCLRVLQRFAVASAEDLWLNWQTSPVSKRGGPGFIQAASFVGHLIERGFLSRELVRRYLPKPLTTHYYSEDNFKKQSIRANAIYQLFAAGNNLLKGLLEPEDVRICFEKLDTRITIGGVGGLDTLDVAKVNELREIHAAWLRRNGEEEQGSAPATENLPAGVKTPIAFVPKDLPTMGNTGEPNPGLQVIDFLPVLHDAESSPSTFTDYRLATNSSPTLSISTVSDLTSTELGDDIDEGDDERIPTHHETFYLEDGNVEITCGYTIFRIHSSIVSFSSLSLRDMLSPPTLLGAPTPEGCPRIVFKDSPEDFAVLLKMIYTPGFPARHKVPDFTTFASLLRMATKYGFSDVREQLIEDLDGAYPTKWGDFEAARVLGEDVFGSPQPHPNAILNLFLEQNIRFALPFAAYRATLGGFPSLTSNEPDTILPRLTLAFIIHGIQGIRYTMLQVSHSIIYDGNLRVCPQKTCILNVDINPMERRIQALRKVLTVMVGGSKGDVLSPPSLGDIVCVHCTKLLEGAHHRCREQLVWGALPSLLSGPGPPGSAGYERRNRNHSSPSWGGAMGATQQSRPVLTGDAFSLLAKSLGSSPG